VTQSEAGRENSYGFAADAFFIVAMVLILLAALGEAGSAGLPRAISPARSLSSARRRPGWGSPRWRSSTAWSLHGGLMGLSMLLPKGIHAKLQGIATLIVSFLLLLGCIVTGFLIFTLLLLMVGLLLAPIFGTWPISRSTATSTRPRPRPSCPFLMLLKLGLAICLVVAHQRFLQNKGLVLIVLTTLLAQIVTSFLHGFPPGFLVSITDAIAGLITVILTAIWSIVFLVLSIISIYKALRVDRDLSGQT
jgi:VanZ family protein